MVKLSTEISGPTMRASDAGDSDAIPSLVLRLIIFLVDSFAVPAPARVTQTVKRPENFLGGADVEADKHRNTS